MNYLFLCVLLQNVCAIKTLSQRIWQNGTCWKTKIVSIKVFGTFVVGNFIAWLSEIPAQRWKIYREATALYSCVWGWRQFFRRPRNRNWDQHDRNRWWLELHGFQTFKTICLPKTFSFQPQKSSTVYRFYSFLRNLSRPYLNEVRSPRFPTLF